MSELSLVAAALSSIINHPVKTYRECVANGLDVLPNQFLDLDLVHKYSFVKEGDDKVVQKPSFRQGDEIDEIDEIDEKVVHRRSRQGDEKNEKNGNRRSRQDDEKDEKVVDRCSFFNKKVQGILDINILPPQPIQIFVKASFGKSHSIFVAPNITVLELKQAIQAKLYIHRPIRLGFSGKILNDSRTLESYKIKRSDTIHILFRILGGCEF
ncbi:ubiquitin-related domain-containing protein, partial [Rhizophagus irregularis DAOM 181602=DAOM 197198]